MNDSADLPRVLIVASNASQRFGGEAVLPLNYFRLLRERGVETWLLTHARVRDELRELLGDDAQRVHYIEDTWLHRGLHRLRRLSYRHAYELAVGLMLDIATQVSLRRRARQLVKRLGIQVVHQPTPVSPKSPSLLFGLGAPAVIGPMNGGIDYPTGFRGKQFVFQHLAVSAGHTAAQLANVLFPGKRLACRLLVANRRTAAALPAWRTVRVIEMFENGVDLRRWQGLADERTRERGPIRFVNMGRLVDIKVIDLLLEAFARLELDPPPQLDVLGDGPEYVALKRQAVQLGIADRVTLHGFVPMAEAPAILAQADVMVHPCLCEAGGAAVMEGMATGLPVIAADWGGPADYVTPDCGVLIAPRDRVSYVADLVDAMTRLATSAPLRKRLGIAARQRAREVFSWSAKIDRMLEIYDDCRREHVSANPRL